MFMAGGGIKPGMTYGETDEFGYNVKDPMHVHDLPGYITASAWGRPHQTDV